MGEQVAFIGLGVMGYPMAGHLARAGHEVTVFNRTAAKAQKWVEEFGGSLASSPAEAARAAAIIFTCVGNDDDVRDVTLGEGSVLEGMKPGALLVDHTTASAGIARELDAATKVLDCGFLDAPVSGGQAGAENGTLTVMVGGAQADFDRAAPVIEACARMCKLLGPVGAGQLTKMVNQICFAGIIQSLSEGLHFANAVGLDGRAVVDVISKGAAQSWQMENRYETMLDGEFEHGFAVDWMRKDLAICFDEARANGVDLPVAHLVDQFYSEVQAMGGARWDTSSLIARLEAGKGNAQ